MMIDATTNTRTARHMTTKASTRRLIDAMCTTLKNDGAVSELRLLLDGYSRAQIDELYAAVENAAGEKRIRVHKVAVGIVREADGVPVYGDIEWKLCGRGRDVLSSRPLSPREKKLMALSDQGLSVNLWNRRTGRYLELPELMAEIAAAKDLLAA